MHSAFETAGARDTELMVKALTAFFLSRIAAEGDGAYTLG
jgi:aspartyl aminopeptidase